jgi:peptide chain release factor 2
LRNWRPWGGIFDLAGKTAEIQGLEKKTLSSGFWNDPEKAQEVTRRISLLKDEVQRFRRIEAGIRDLEAAAELIEEDENEGAELLRESIPHLKEIEKSISELELRSLLGEEEDQRSAIITINPGAGGTESQDWAQILLRMYARPSVWRRGRDQGGDTGDRGCLCVWLPQG